MFHITLITQSAQTHLTAKNNKCLKYHKSLQMYAKSPKICCILSKICRNISH
ncbi:hypothetical protein AO375_0023 [Moraxella catarrhalis]|nr:hypothetical protein AO375_0023 [Moraxella catarrhalis]